MAKVLSAHWLDRSPRVAYSAPVRLSGAWSDREPCFVPLLAQSLDLSERGMALVTALDVAPGSVVTCSMRIGGRQLYLVGHVVWAQGSDAGLRRVGIRFDPPGDDDQGVMQRLLTIGQTHPHRVSVRFEGRPDSITALAKITRSGVALTAPLPILRRHTGVRIAFEAGGEPLHGHVERVRLTDVEGMPALRVGIRLPVVQARLARQERERADATPPSVEVAIARDEAAPSFLSGMLQRANTLRGAALLACGLSAIGCGALLRLALTPAAAEPVPMAVTQARAPTPTIAAPLRTPKRADPAPRVEPIAAPAPVAIGAPSFKWRRERREILVPLDGSARELRHYRIGEPPAIAIELPHARVADAQRYAVQRPGVSRVDVEPFGEGVRIRIWLRDDVSTYRVESAPTGVRITLPVER